MELTDDSSYLHLSTFQPEVFEKNAKAKRSDEEEGCSVLMMILLSGPRLVAAMSWSAQYSLMGPYLETLLPSYVVQLTQFMGPAIGIFVSPIVGVLSDYCTSRFGRRRPFLVFGAVSSVMCWTLMGFTKEFGEMLGDTTNERHLTGVFAIIFYAWSGFTVNVFSTPAQLILADFAGNRQTTAAAIGQAGFTLGFLIVAIYVEAFGNPSSTLKRFLGVLSGIMVLTVGLVCVFAKETPLVLAEKKKPVSSQVKNSVKEIFHGFKSMHSQMLILGIIFFCRCYGSTAYHGSKTQYFGLIIYNGTSKNADTCSTSAGGCLEEQLAYNKGVQVAGGKTDIIYGVVGYIVSWVLPIIVKHFGVKKVVSFGMLPQVLFVLLAFCRVKEVDITIVVLSSITQAFIDGTLVPIVIHLLGMQGEENIGMYVGVFNSFDCLGQLMNFGIAAALVTTSMGYALPILVGGVISFIGFLVASIFLKVKLYSL